MRKLLAAAKRFSLDIPKLECLCALALACRVWPDLTSHSLDALAAHIHHQFDHHNACADAEAAGRILLAMMAAIHVISPRALAKAVGLRPMCVARGNACDCKR